MPTRTTLRRLSSLNNCPTGQPLTIFNLITDKKRVLCALIRQRFDNLIVRVQGGATKHMPVTNIAGRVDLIDYEMDVRGLWREGIIAYLGV